MLQVKWPSCQNQVPVDMLEVALQTIIEGLFQCMSHEFGYKQEKHLHIKIELKATKNKPQTKLITHLQIKEHHLDFSLTTWQHHLLLHNSMLQSLKDEMLQ